MKDNFFLLSYQPEQTFPCFVFKIRTETTTFTTSPFSFGSVFVPTDVNTLAVSAKISSTMTSIHLFPVTSLSLFTEYVEEISNGKRNKLSCLQKDQKEYPIYLKYNSVYYVAYSFCQRDFAAT